MNLPLCMCQGMVIATSTFDIAAALSDLTASRAAGVRVGAAQYSQILLGCADVGAPVAVYRTFEEALTDGVRFGDLSHKAQQVLRVPPEAESFATHTHHDRSTFTGSPFSDPLPNLWVKPEESVLEFDCSTTASGGREAALASAWAVVAQRDAPVLFRGVGSHWPALHEWTLPRLRDSMARGMVRVSPSASVTFCRETHPDVQSGLIEPPSRLVSMCLEEFAQRLHEGRGGRAPLLYGDGERVYLQALAPHAMMELVDFSFLPGRSSGRSSSAAFGRQPSTRAAPLRALARLLSWPRGGGGGGGGAASDSTSVRQPPVLGRLWVSAAGTVSPLHYDMQDSYLCQVRGAKRMLLWPDTALPALRPFPDDHHLARRLQTSIVAPPPGGWEADTALASVSSPLEATLYPGDVLYFPSNWAHHTEALPSGPSGRGDCSEPGNHDQAQGAAGGAEPEDGVSFSLGFRTDGTYLL